MKNNKGFTLIELMVAMVLFVIVIMITGNSFETILGQSSRLFRSEESNIEGMIGLEMLRHDLQQAGLGLYTEPAPAIGTTKVEAASAPAANYNDYPDNHVPRAIVFDDILVSTALGDSGVAKSIIAGTDYLAVKATTVARNSTSQKWSFLDNSGVIPAPSTWSSGAENYNSSDERFVLLRKSFSTPPRTTLERNIPQDSHWFSKSTSAFNAYTTQGSSVFLTYGIDDDSFKFPFNRADFFVARTNSGADMPLVCAPNTGILYKGAINQGDGKTTYLPLLDCVADMQVVLGWDIDLNGTVDTWSNAKGNSVSGAGTVSQVQSAISQPRAANDNNDTNEQSTVNIRNCLKVVKVYLIVQDGKKDRNYTSPSTIQIGDLVEGTLLRDGTASPAVYTLTSDMLNYRWKEYRIVVRPKNLLSNQ